MLWIISVSSTVLPTPAPPKSPAFAAALQRHEHVDDLDAGLEDFGLRGAARSAAAEPDAQSATRTSDNAASRSMMLPNTSNIRERLLSHRRLQRSAGVLHRHAAREALRRRQRIPRM